MREAIQKKAVEAAVDDEGFMGCHPVGWIAKKMKKDEATVKRLLDNDGVPYQRKGNTRWYRDEVMAAWMQRGDVPAPRRGRARRLPPRAVS